MRTHIHESTALLLAILALGLGSVALGQTREWIEESVWIPVDQPVPVPPRLPNDGQPLIEWPVAPGIPVATRTAPREDILNPKTRAMDSLTVDPRDSRRIVIRYWGGASECYGERVRVTESADQVTIQLESGQLPEAQDRACISLAIYREMEIILANGLGSRKLVAVDPNLKDPPVPQPPGTPPENDPALYQGLQLHEAIVKAHVAGRRWRITRIGSQHFPVTRDMRPDRLNFEVDDGTVTGCHGG